jgi:hypothetical protein
MTAIFSFFLILFSCRYQETGGSLVCGGGRLALMPSHRSQARSSSTRCVLFLFFSSLPYFEFLDKVAFSWLAVYLVQELRQYEISCSSPLAVELAPWLHSGWVNS